MIDEGEGVCMYVCPTDDTLTTNILKQFLFLTIFLDKAVMH